MFRRRLVRLHLDGDAPSLEGLRRRLPVRRNGHYVLELASLIQGEDRAFKLEGERVMVPRERVVFVQELRG